MDVLEINVSFFGSKDFVKNFKNGLLIEFLKMFSA